jgi:hypothetical protein
VSSALAARSAALVGGDGMILPRFPRVALTATALLLLLGQTGCLSYLNAVSPPTSEEIVSCKQIPKPCRSEVYIFFVHGMDPLDFANLSGVRDYVQSLGFIKTYYGQLYHTWYFEDEIRRLHKLDPEARFVLVGFSFGANMVRDMANDLRADNISIDLLVYLGGNTLTNDSKDRPENALHIVNILATGWIWNGAELDNAENINYGDAWHFGSPTHPKTLDLLAHDLTEIAARVPFVEPAFSPPETLPGPRSVTVPTAAERDDWDFLLPGETIPDLPAKPPPQKTSSRDHMMRPETPD